MVAELLTLVVLAVVESVVAAFAAPAIDMMLPAKIPAVTRPAALRMFFFFIFCLLANELFAR